MSNSYDKSEASRINSLPPEELGEGGPFLEFDIPFGLKYDEYPVTEAGYDGRRVYVEYEGSDLIDGWNCLTFPTRLRHDGTIVVTGVQAGLLTARKVYETRTETPHAEALRPLYDFLYAIGVEFDC